MEIAKTKLPKVSIIIPCYNHGHYLAQAIESIVDQSYSNIEIIVIDDGSSDNTKSVATSFGDHVRYSFQKNSGLSAARNKGIDLSTGKYLVFLDADDWLYATGISTNVSWLEKNPDWAFVSGSHNKVDDWKNILEEGDPQPSGDHYRHFLQGNYIGMHATVMYQRWILDEFRFDTSLKACEDYDLYLKISRAHPVGNHAGKIAAYRIHDSNMSSDNSLMLDRVLHVLNRQKKFLRSADEFKAFQSGQETWREYYLRKILSNLSRTFKKTNEWPTMNEMRTLFRYKPVKTVSYLGGKLSFEAKNALKKRLPENILRKLNSRGRFHQYIPSVGKIEFGDFNRVTPFSNDFGFDRGGAIDRYYIEKFLTENQHFIRGKVLEVGDNEYTLKYGRQPGLHSDILHVDASNERATIVGDITDVPQIRSGNFDCVILTQTLHLIYDFKKALATCYRILKPGGALLMTVPGITQIDQGPWKEYWLWSFTDTAMRKVMQETFNGSSIDIQTYGNVKVASSFLYGVGLPEIDERSLDYHDPHYQVIISVKAIKS